ncbi:hypothetical protein [Leptospira weilii]|uniref:hypothetical protein n=1 Tax=Leptospira weilii TaxID=28184 RepID=UPI0007742CF1|nr:hypothetical protein [Leptospira weilii]
MDPINYLKINPIGEGASYYEVYDSRTDTVVYGHPSRVWCIDWVIEEHLRYIAAEEKRMKKG